MGAMERVGSAGGSVEKVRHEELVNMNVKDFGGEIGEGY